MFERVRVTPLPSLSPTPARARAAKCLAPLITSREDAVGIDKLAPPRDIWLVGDALSRVACKVLFNALAIRRVEVPASESVRA